MLSQRAKYRWIFSTRSVDISAIHGSLSSQGGGHACEFCRGRIRRTVDHWSSKYLDTCWIALFTSHPNWYFTTLKSILTSQRMVSSLPFSIVPRKDQKLSVNE